MFFQHMKGTAEAPLEDGSGSFVVMESARADLQRQFIRADTRIPKMNEGGLKFRLSVHQCFYCIASQK